MTVSERLFAVRQIEHDNGDTTWVPVDLDTFTEDDQFQVFNTFTGTHEYFDNIAGAKARWDELKQQIEAMLAIPVSITVLNSEA